MNGFELHKSQVNFERACERVQEDQTISEENKKLKHKYSKLGIIVTRATLRKTITQLFKAKA